MISIDDSATDAAGNVNTTSFNVVQSGLTLDHLWSASIEGASKSRLGKADAVVKPS